MRALPIIWKRTRTVGPALVLPSLVCAAMNAPGKNAGNCDMVWKSRKRICVFAPRTTAFDATATSFCCNRLYARYGQHSVF